MYLFDAFELPSPSASLAPNIDNETGFAAYSSTEVLQALNLSKQVGAAHWEWVGWTIAREPCGDRTNSVRLEHPSRWANSMALKMYDTLFGSSPSLSWPPQPGYSTGTFQYTTPANPSGETAEQAYVGCGGS